MFAAKKQHYPKRRAARNDIPNAMLAIAPIKIKGK